MTKRKLIGSNVDYSEVSFLGARVLFKSLRWGRGSVGGMGTRSVYIIEETTGSCWWECSKESDVNGDHW